MNRRNLLAAALGLPLAPVAAMAAPFACTGSPDWLRNAYFGVPSYGFIVDELDPEAVQKVWCNGELIWERPSSKQED